MYTVIIEEFSKRAADYMLDLVRDLDKNRAPKHIRLIERDSSHPLGNPCVMASYEFGPIPYIRPHEFDGGRAPVKMLGYFFHYHPGHLY